MNKNFHILFNQYFFMLISFLCIIMMFYTMKEVMRQSANISVEKYNKIVESYHPQVEEFKEMLKGVDEKCQQNLIISEKVFHHQEQQALNQW